MSVEVVQPLHEHQLEALGKIKNGSVLAGGVGSGKSRVAIAAYVKACGGSLDRLTPMTNPLKLIIITTAKKRDNLDWYGEALHFGLFFEPELSYSGTDFIVDSWNNIEKYKDEKGAYFIFDEQRVVGTGKWVKSFLKIAREPSNGWLLLSATPADTWMDYIPLFLAHGFYRTRTDFIEEHVAWQFTGKYRKVRGFYGVSHLRALRDSILVEMPFERHTVRHLVAEPVEHDETLFSRVWKSRWNVYDDVPLVDVSEMHRVGRKVVNSDPSRLAKIEELWAKHPRLIVFYNFDYELEILRKLAFEPLCNYGVGHVEGASEQLVDRRRDGAEVAEWNGHKHQEVPETDKWIYLVQYQAGAEGWNCVATNAIVFYSLTYSHKIFEQAQGRIDRLDTQFVDLFYYILMSNSKIDKLIWRALVLKKNFHEGRNKKFVPSENRTIRD